MLFGSGDRSECVRIEDVEIFGLEEKDSGGKVRKRKDT